eukprot:1202244-Pleurochrysis_carterae.AAC.1
MRTAYMPDGPSMKPRKRTTFPSTSRKKRAPSSCTGSSTSNCHAQHSNASKTGSTAQSGPASSNPRLRMPCATFAC